MVPKLKGKKREKVDYIKAKIFYAVNDICESKKTANRIREILQKIYLTSDFYSEYVWNSSNPKIK